jgi:hypothetical protein
MGITIAYRGRLADLTRIEDFEDRLLDFALEVGGQAQIWRTYDDDDPKRMVRGVILDLAPGLESTSLLVSPEGWLNSFTGPSKNGWPPARTMTRRSTTRWPTWD